MPHCCLCAAESVTAPGFCNGRLSQTPDASQPSEFQFASFYFITVLEASMYQHSRFPYQRTLQLSFQQKNLRCCASLLGPGKAREIIAPLPRFGWEHGVRNRGFGTSRRENNEMSERRRAETERHTALGRGEHAVRGRPAGSGGGAARPGRAGSGQGSPRRTHPPEAVQGRSPSRKPLPLPASAAGRVLMT